MVDGGGEVVAQGNFEEVQRRVEGFAEGDVPEIIGEDGEAVIERRYAVGGEAGAGEGRQQVMKKLILHKRTPCGIVWVQSLVNPLPVVTPVMIQG